jgi:hypothetical protein
MEKIDENADLARILEMTGATLLCRASAGQP